MGTRTCATANMEQRPDVMEANTQGNWNCKVYTEVTVYTHTLKYSYGTSHVILQGCCIVERSLPHE